MEKAPIALKKAVLRAFLEYHGAKLNEVEIDELMAEFEAELNLIVQGFNYCISSQLIRRKLLEN